MKNIMRTTLPALALFALASCIEDKPERPGEGDEMELRIVPVISQTSSGNITDEVMTRALVDGAFPVGSMIGLGISAPGATPALSPLYNDFYATFGGDAWRYSLDPGVRASDRLSGFSTWGAIEVYGYYPYDADVTDLGAIPFEIAALDGAEAKGTEVTATNDYMVAGTQAKNMAVPTGTDLPLHFGHMMTSIELIISRILGNESLSQRYPVLTLARVTFEITDGAREFVVSGTYDATNPDTSVLTNNITAVGKTQKMVIDYPSSPEITYYSSAANTPPVLLIIMPELRQKAGAGFEDAEVTMTFDFRDQDGEFIELDDGPATLSFRLSEVANAGNDNGLLAGYSYAITARVGTYTHFLAPTEGTLTPPHVNNPGLYDDPEDDQFIEM